ncbi:MAG: hypothetical protein ACLFTT_16250 [Candidatus Hydrogenedentota bacterium]
MIIKRLGILAIAVVLAFISSQVSEYALMSMLGVGEPNLPGPDYQYLNPQSSLSLQEMGETSNGDNQTDVWTVFLAPETRYQLKIVARQKADPVETVYTFVLGNEALWLGLEGPSQQIPGVGIQLSSAEKDTDLISYRDIDCDGQIDIQFREAANSEETTAHIYRSHQYVEAMLAPLSDSLYLREKDGTPREIVFNDGQWLFAD